MPAMKGLEWTFDTVAFTYEKLRPGYVKELYQTLFKYILLMKIAMLLRLEVAEDKRRLRF